MYMFIKVEYHADAEYENTLKKSDQCIYNN